MTPSFLTFLALQLDRLKAKPESHAPGPKKPDLTEIELGLKK